MNNSNTPVYYFDISKSGKDYTGSKDISLLKNELAILESIKNILITEPGERIMYPEFGCGLSRYMFEPIDPIMILSMRKTIVTAIQSFEGERITNLTVDIKELPDQNTVLIYVLFNVKTSSNTQSLSLTLNKIR